MHLGMLLDMASEGLGDRVAIGSLVDGLTYADLALRCRRAGTLLADMPGGHVVLVDENSPAVPIALFGAALAAKPFVPLNYRLADDRLRAIAARVSPAIVITGVGVAKRLDGIEGLEFLDRDEFLARGLDDSLNEADPWGCDPDGVALLLFTSGTTGDPKAAVLRHCHLAAYVVGSLEFASAGEDEAAVVCVPPYHIASVSSALSTMYVGRRVVQLERFDPDLWVAAVRAEHATHAMVVPTMLNRILDVIEADGGGLTSMRSLAYGGGPMPQPVIERAMRLLSDVDLVNAYGLTETSSTITVLGPADHRAAFASDDPNVRARLGSVGKPLPGVELSIRDEDGAFLATGEVGEVWVRGEQVAGEYLGMNSAREDGWFPTRDAGRLDDEGYLFVEGRLDDVIVRGGENISPGEIEAVLVRHPAVEEAAVVGLPDVEWGERIAAVVVLRPGEAVTTDELQSHVRGELRSTRTPEVIEMRDSLPFSETGKLLRRVLRDELVDREKHASQA